MPHRVHARYTAFTFPHPCGSVGFVTCHGFPARLVRVPAVSDVLHRLPRWFNSLLACTFHIWVHTVSPPLPIHTHPGSHAHTHPSMVPSTHIHTFAFYTPPPPLPTPPHRPHTALCLLPHAHHTTRDAHTISRGGHHTVTDAAAATHHPTTTPLQLHEHATTTTLRMTFAHTPPTPLFTFP